MSGVLVSPFQSEFIHTHVVLALEEQFDSRKIFVGVDSLPEGLDAHAVDVYLLMVYDGWLAQDWINDPDDANIRALRSLDATDTKIIPVTTSEKLWPPQGASLPPAIDEVRGRIGVALDFDNTEQAEASDKRRQSVPEFLANLERIISSQIQVAATGAVIAETVYAPVHLKKPNYLLLAGVGALLWGALFTFIGFAMPIYQFDISGTTHYAHSFDVNFVVSLIFALLAGIAGYGSFRILTHYAPGTAYSTSIGTVTWAVALLVLFDNNGDNVLNGMRAGIFLLAIPLSVILAYGLPRPVIWWRLNRRTLRQLLFFLFLMSAIFVVAMVTGGIAAISFEDEETRASARAFIVRVFSGYGLIFGVLYLPTAVWWLKRIALNYSPESVQVQLEG